MSIDEILTPKNVWIVLNIILILYSLILFCYGKYSGRKHSLLFVIYNFYNYICYYFQRDIAEGNGRILGRPDESIRITDIKNNNLDDDKNINLIEN